MADEENNNESAEEQGEDKAKKKIDPRKLKLAALIMLFLLLIGGSIGGTLYVLGVFDGGEPAEELAAEESAEPVSEEGAADKLPAKPPAMYFPIKPAFVINYSARGRQRFLQAEVTVLTRDQQVFDAIQQHLPLVKNQLVMLFGGESYEDLQTDEGRELLRQKSIEVLQNTIAQEIGKEDGVEEVLFTSFVMQ
jgi:flagellar FliL protein